MQLTTNRGILVWPQWRLTLIRKLCRSISELQIIKTMGFFLAIYHCFIVSGHSLNFASFKIWKHSFFFFLREHLISFYGMHNMIVLFLERTTKSKFGTMEGGFLLLNIKRRRCMSQQWYLDTSWHLATMMTARRKLQVQSLFHICRIFFFYSLVVFYLFIKIDAVQQ